MDNKTIPHADEKSSMHLSPLPSKSQAQGVPKAEIVAKQRATEQDPASLEADKRRRL
ncbi:MAG: hypothetical protein OWT28_05545 [Firmicutes bacterium]|nr:hypothetical protein [Bacillota bacterium]